MKRQKENITLRPVTKDDAQLLTNWWNDGRVMEHAGFPNGLGQSVEETRRQIENWENSPGAFFIIEIDGVPVGETSFSLDGKATAYPGWKICEASYQNLGHGPKLIRMLFDFIFSDKRTNEKIQVDKIFWDTTLDNRRAQHVYEEKLHACKVRIVKDAFIDQLGNKRSAVEYEITREEFYGASS